MLLETTLMISIASGIVPSMFWGQEWTRRRSMELEYNIRIAQSLGHAATLRDHETGAHNLRVAYLASLFGEAYGFNKKEIRSLMKGAFLHDVGKIGIPDKILLKQAALDQDEWLVMREHPVMGEKLLANMPWFQDAIPVVLHHHERYDGSGYPAGLAGKTIPVTARIFAVIDVFDALLAARPYKAAFNLPQTLDILEKESGSHFDPEITERFMQLAPDLAEEVAGRTEQELKAMLEIRRRKIFGL